MSTITLPNIRVSSDLTVSVRLKDNGVAIDWSTLNNVKASIYSDAQRALAGRCDVSVDAEDPTVLVCQYAANKPQYVGVCRIVVSAKYMGETKTYDKPAFNFVRWTADQDGEQITIDDPDVDVEIDVADVSSSLLDEAIRAAFTAAEEAVDAKGQVLETEAEVEAAEALRVSAEESRVEAEEGRAEAEAARVDEEAVRVSAEDARVVAENARAAAEDLREGAEDDRAAAETARETAEAARVAAEALRVTAEGSRETAEAAREAQASADHTVAAGDHTQAAADHTQAAADHTTAASDHTQAGADHTLAAADHVTAGEDHAQAQDDHEVMEGYDTRLGSVESEVSQLEAEVDDILLPVASQADKSIIDYVKDGSIALAGGYWATLHSKTLPDRPDSGTLKRIEFLAAPAADTSFTIRLYKKVWTNGQITGFTAVPNGDYSFTIPANTASLDVSSSNITIDGDVIIAINGVAKYRSNTSNDNFCIYNGSYNSSLQGKFTMNVDYIVSLPSVDSERLINIEQSIAEIEDQTEGIVASERELGLGGVEYSEFNKGSDYTFGSASIATSDPVASTSNQGEDKYIPVTAGKVVEIKANNTNPTLAIFLTVQTFVYNYKPVDQGTMGNGTSTGFVIPAGTSKSFLILTDCYLHLMEGANLSFWPQSIQYRNADGNIQKLFDAVFAITDDVDELKTRPDILENRADADFPAVNTSGVEYPSFGTGSDFIAIDKDSLILTNAHGYSSCADIAFYDEDKQFLGYLGGESYGSIKRFGVYDIPVAYQNAKFIRASFYQVNVAKYLYVFDAPTTKIKGDLYDDSVIISHEYETATIQSSCVFSGDSLSVVSDGGQFQYRTILTKEEGAYTTLLALKMRCESITGADGVDVSYNTHCYEEGVAADDVITMVVRYDSSVYFKISKISTWTILGVSFVFVKSEFADALFTDNSLYQYKYTQGGGVGFTAEIDQWLWRNCYLMKNDVFDLEGKHLVKGTPRAECSHLAEAVKNSNPFFYGKTYCCFGTSISAGSSSGGDVATKPYCKYVGGYFGMKVKNLAKTSTVCYGENGNIRTELLAMMPSDTMLVSMLNGANGWITSEDINSTDTSNAIGAYNVAIDYIREHYPLALIVIGADQSFGSTREQAEKDLRRIAENKKVLLAHTYHITNNVAQRADTIHPTVDSKLRLAAGVIAAAENGILKTIIECDEYETITW